MTAPIQESTRADPGEQDTLHLVRGIVRSLLVASPAYQKLEQNDRKAMAESMVKVCHTAAELIRDELKTSDRLGPTRPAFATAQSADQQFSGVAADRVAGTTRAILNAVSFPRFVTELITGGLPCHC
jgi:hypothetical protein